jgi:hypothetical protein
MRLIIKMSLADNMIYLYKHQFKMSYKYRLIFHNLSEEETVNIKNICKNLKPITDTDTYYLMFNFYYDGKSYDVYVEFYSYNITHIYISYIDIDDKKVINYLLSMLNLKGKYYTKQTPGIRAVSTLNMKINNSKILKLGYFNSLNKNNISLNLNCETFINKKHGGLCIKGRTLTDIIEVYTEIYTIIKLPIVLKSLFKCKNSLFYYLPYELKNVILSFM